MAILHNGEMRLIHDAGTLHNMSFSNTSSQYCLTARIVTSRSSPLTHVNGHAVFHVDLLDHFPPQATKW